MITKGLLIQLYGLLSQSSLEKCDVAERIEIVKVLRRARQEVEAAQGFVDDVRQRNQDILSTETDNVKIAELNKAINDELSKAAETKELNVLGKDTIYHLSESNPKWTPAIIMLVEDVFGKEKKGEGYE